MKYQRQVDRAITAVKSGDVMFALASLEQIKRGAIVLHLDSAWHAFVWYLSAIFTGKCGVCGHRHFGLLRLITPSEPAKGYGGSRLTCVYGYWQNFKSVWHQPFVKLLHGVD